MQLAYLQNCHKIYERTRKQNLPDDFPDRDESLIEQMLRIQVLNIKKLLESILTKEFRHISSQNKLDLDDLIAKITFFTNWFLLLRSASDPKTSKYKTTAVKLREVIQNLKTKKYGELKDEIESYYARIQVLRIFLQIDCSSSVAKI